MANTKPLEKVKKAVSSGSAAGKLRDRQKQIQDELRKAGVAKAGNRTKPRTRLA